jgi:anti-sigma B factor antagonist
MAAGKDPALNPAPFQAQSKTVDGVRVIAIQGELDLGTAPQLEEPLEAALAAGEAPLLIDLTGCEFIDSTGIALIVRAWQQLDSASSDGGRSTRFALCCLNDQVQRLLEITGLETSIPVHPSRDAALAALRAESAGSGTR